MKKSTLILTGLLGTTLLVGCSGGLPSEADVRAAWNTTANQTGSVSEQKKAHEIVQKAIKHCSEEKNMNTEYCKNLPQPLKFAIQGNMYN